MKTKWILAKNVQRPAWQAMCYPVFSRACTEGIPVVKRSECTAFTDCEKWLLTMTHRMLGLDYVHCE